MGDTFSNINNSSIVNREPRLIPLRRAVELVLIERILEELGVDQVTPDVLVNKLARYDIVLAKWRAP